MKIAVLIKQVPVSGNVAVDPETHALVREGSEGMINPADLNAIEAAMVLKENTDGYVTVFTMGPPDAEKSLRDAMALGCDDSCLITDRCVAGGDTIATARVLAKSIEKYGTFDLILGGALSADGATGQVGAMVAEYMGIPHISEIQSIIYDVSAGSHIEAIKKYQGANLKIRTALPALMTVCFGSNEPRLATLRTKWGAKNKPLTTYTNAELGMPLEEVGLLGSPTVVINSYAPESVRKAQMLTGTPKELAQMLKNLIDEEKGKE